MPEATGAGSTGLANVSISGEEKARFEAALQQAQAQNASAGARASDPWLDALDAYQDGPSAYEDAFVEAGAQRQAAAAGEHPYHPLGPEFHPLGGGLRMLYDSGAPATWERTPGARLYRDMATRVFQNPDQLADFLKEARGMSKSFGVAATAYGGYTLAQDLLEASPDDRPAIAIRGAGGSVGGAVGSSAGIGLGGAAGAYVATTLGLAAGPAGWVMLSAGAGAALLGGWVGGKAGGGLVDSIADRASLPTQLALANDLFEYDRSRSPTPDVDQTQAKDTGYPADYLGPLLGIPDSWPEPQEPAAPPATSGSTPAPASGAGPASAPSPAPAPVPGSSPEPSLAPPTGGDTGASPQGPAQAGPAPTKPKDPAPAPQSEEYFEPVLPADVLVATYDENGNPTYEIKPYAPPAENEDDNDGAGGAPTSGGSERPNPDADPAPGTGPTYPVFRSNGAGAIRPAEDPPITYIGGVDLGGLYNRPNGPGAVRPAEGGPIFDVDNFDLGNVDLSAIYGRPNGPGVINPVPDGIAEPAPRGGTLPTGPGDPNVMTAGLGRFGLG